MIAPLLPVLVARGDATVFTQDDPQFPPGVDAVHDGELELSWHHAIETVPTLMRVVDGKEMERTVGWSRAGWQRITGIADLGDGTARAMRPGCGSLSARPGPGRRAPRAFRGRAAAHRGASSWRSGRTTSRPCSTAGGPTVCPSCRRPRSACCACSTGRRARPTRSSPSCRPISSTCTVEKVAINAVMAGCQPEYLPVVLAAVEAACTDEFNIHGVLATTMPRRPGDRRQRTDPPAIGMNSGVQRAGPGQPRQRDDRPRAAARRPQRRRRPSRRGRPRHARQPGQVHLLLRRGRGGLAVRAAVGEPGRRRRAPTPSRCSPARGRAASSTSCRREPESLAPLARRLPADGAAPEARARLRRHPGRVAGARAGVRAKRAGTAPRCWPELGELPAIPGAELVRGAGGIAEGLPGVRGRDAAEVPPRRAPARARRWRGGPVLGDHRWLGERRVGSQPVTREVGA